jgi:uncharacterized protein
MGRAEQGLLRIEVAYSPGPRQLDCVAVQLPAGSTLADAVAASGMAQRHGLPSGALDGGVWGCRQPPGHLLRDGDRVELYRPLSVDPKQARHLRHEAQKKRPAKAGR